MENALNWLVEDNSKAVGATGGGAAALSSTTNTTTTSTTTSDGKNSKGQLLLTDAPHNNPLVKQRERESCVF